MAVDLATVVKQLADSGIIAPGKLENFIPPKADPKTPEELVQALVKSENLTAFQGQQVKAGKARALILGAYTILDKIGAGGMGQVFKAEHRKMGRLVAIKMLPPAMTKDAAAIARFEREVRAAAKLRHPNIVAADDAAEAHGAHFLVMEYVEGKDLSAMVKRDGPFPVGKAVNYILQAARGLEFAHSKGVIHRDIKPANLLLSTDGVVKILDMGLARIESDGPAQTELTGTGTIMGTVDYMSPEQALNTKHADHRADIYSLGISLYYLLAGKAAYSGDTAMEKLMAHQTQPIPSLQEVQTTVSKQLDAVFKKMVAKKIEDRYQSMSEVIEALEGLGYGGSNTGRKGDVASTLDLSSADKKKLAAQAKKKPLGSITEVVASEKSKNLVLKIVGGSFGTIVAPILVFYLIRHLDKQEQPANPPAATAPAATVPPVVVATNTPPQPPAHVVDDGSPKPLVAPFDTKQAHASQAAWAKHLETKVESKNSVGMTLVLIPPGKFQMGSTDEQVRAALKVAEELKVSQADMDRIQKSEGPQHRVVITKPLLMSATEVAVGQFRKFVEATKYVTEAEQYGFGNSGDKALIGKVKPTDRGLNWKSPGYTVTEESPVAQITWNDACAYCAWLSEQDKRTPSYRADGKGGWLIAAQASGYRLPTEAEWEYACRSGTTTQYSFGDDYGEFEQFGWYNQNAGHRAQPVALKLPNSFGLLDMHGNLQEWCQDFYDENWYEKPQSNDPKGPSSGPSRVIRGGYWDASASLCRSAFRYSNSPSSRYYSFGFRVVRVADAAADSQLARNTTPQPTTPVTPATTQPNLSWNTPAFQQWMRATQTLPAEKQIEAVSKKLMELNPGFDGVVTSYNGAGTPKIKNGVVFDFKFVADHVADISPVRALVGLKDFDCSGRRKGRVSDLSPLEGMQLAKLACPNTQVSDLSPLQGMPLTLLNVGGTQISDLSPLEGMPLTYLECSKTKVFDLTPLQGMNLIKVFLTPSNVTKGLDVIRQMKSIEIIGTNYAQLVSSAEFWKKYDAGEFGKPAAPAKLAYLDPAFQQWVKATQALPAEKQVEAVSKKLMELNPGFDGKMAGWDEPDAPKNYKGIITALGFFTDSVTDLSPVRALAGLKMLRCGGSRQAAGKLSDLGPLKGMSLTEIKCGNTQVADLSPLQGMPLTFMFCENTQVSDLTPLQGMKLERIAFYSSQVSDLSPLQGMPLKYFSCADTQVSDVSVLIHTPTLTEVDLNSTKVTAAGVAALQKALPNCKIKWRGAAKLAYLDPDFQAWVKATQALPAEQQIDAVSKELMELNPGFDGKVTPKIEKGMVTEFEFITSQVADISPVRALTGLRVLWCNGDGKVKGKLADLSPLQGMPLTSLHCGYSMVADLTPLQGMPLANLLCGMSEVSDLSPLEGMPLGYLLCSYTRVSDLAPLKHGRLNRLGLMGTLVADLSPLRGMPLSSLSCARTQVSDLSPLEDCKNLTNLDVTKTKVTSAQVATLQKALPNCKIEWDGADEGPVASGQGLVKPWNTPAFQAWVKEVQAMPAEKQIEAVSKKLMELNPGFDGTVTGIEGKGRPKIENGAVTELGIVTDNVKDLSPVRAFVGLKVLYGSANGPGNNTLSDLSPLQGMTLTTLHVTRSRVSDLAPLAGMPLTNLYCSRTPVSDLSPLQGMKLVQLNCGLTNVSDLSPLQGMNLTEVRFPPQKITRGLDVIRQMKSLKTIGLQDGAVFPSAEFWKKYDAGEFGKPDPKAESGKPKAEKLAYLDPAFQAWLKDTQALSAEKQVDAVSKKLMELNPGFNGKLKGKRGSATPQIENGMVTELYLMSDNVADISPLRAFVGLQALVCNGKSKLSDLSPLEGLPLTNLDCHGTQVSDVLLLERFTGLKLLNVQKTKVTPASVAALQKALPNCRIYWDEAAAP